MDVMVSVAIAGDAGDSLPRQTDPLVRLDAGSYLRTRREPVIYYARCVSREAQEGARRLTVKLSVS